MKVFIVAAVLAVALVAEAKLTDEQKAAISQRHKECVTESGVDEAVVQKARQGDFADDPKLSEHLFCMSKKSGFQNDAGELQKDVLKQKLGAILDNPEAASKVVDKCAVQKDTPQNTAAETMKCYFANAPARISIF